MAIIYPWGCHPTVEIPPIWAVSQMAPNEGHDSAIVGVQIMQPVVHLVLLV